jgi:hypothetical protein
MNGSGYRVREGDIVATAGIERISPRGAAAFHSFQHGGAARWVS